MNLLVKLVIALLFSSSLFASLEQKSAMVYYGKNISYPMVGVADYIIVQPELTNVHTHGFSLYKEKMYAYVSIGEIETTIKEYNKIKEEWIVAKNKLWKSDVLDIKNVEYQEFIFTQLIEPRMNDGFKNFFFDTLDSYHFYSDTQEQREANEKALVHFIKEFHKRYPDSKLIVNRGFEIMDQIHDSIEAVLFESYYSGLGGDELGYKDVDDEAREWLDTHIDKIKSYGLDIISVEYLEVSKIEKNNEIVQKIQERGMIPYLSNRELTIYGKSSKNAVKREVFTLIDERNSDRSGLESHRHGATVLEYMGYIQKLYNIHDGLPSAEEMTHYAGVVIWLQSDYKQPDKLIKWVKELSKLNIKVLFTLNFGSNSNQDFLAPLNIKQSFGVKLKSKILHQDKLIGYEIEPSMAPDNVAIVSKNIKPLLIYEYTDGTTSTPAAITDWGGYSFNKAFSLDIDKRTIYVSNLYKLFVEALRLETLIVPDVTTQNGKRLLFTHIDGDGIMNRVEGSAEKFSGEIIRDKILKVYKIPHSVSVIGAEIDANGLYPKLSKKLTSIARDIYKLENVEAATHTFTHPYKWGQIKDNNLSENYRLKVKEYNFSLERELAGSINNINSELLVTGKPVAKTVFWSGDCTPRENALEHIYKNNIININGGDTWITKTDPWLSYLGPLGVERGEYYQVYTGAQNENVFTNDWLGPFWGFKKVVQTFEMTNSPRRMKPIDIYYHLYSGSKMASLKALEYVFDWSLKQDVMPIYTSEYIPKVMDFYTVSMAKDGNEWLVEGMKDLKTLRLENKGASIDFDKSQSSIGLKHFENHTYISLDNSTQHYIKISEEKTFKENSYLISSNAGLVDFKNLGNDKSYEFEGHVDLEVNFHVTQNCKLISSPKTKNIKVEGNNISMSFKDVKKASFNITCK